MLRPSQLRKLSRLLSHLSGVKLASRPERGVIAAEAFMRVRVSDRHIHHIIVAVRATA
jgi:hypothetical protein